jgi:hypothetical protein
MTKKDYELIANGFVMTLTSAYNGPEGYKLAVEYMADELEHENPRFNRIKFMEACGIKLQD